MCTCMRGQKVTCYVLYMIHEDHNTVLYRLIMYLLELVESYYLLQEYAEHLNQKYIEIAVQQNSELSKHIALSQAEVCILLLFMKNDEVYI